MIKKIKSHIFGRFHSFFNRGKFYAHYRKDNTKNNDIKFIHNYFRAYRAQDLIALMSKMALYKDLFLIKLTLVLVPFAILLLLTNFLVAFIIFAINVFCITIVFKIANNISRNIVYKKKYYYYIKSKRINLAIIILIVFSFVSIYIGKYLVVDFVKYLTTI